MRLYIKRRLFWMCIFFIIGIIFILLHYDLSLIENEFRAKNRKEYNKLIEINKREINTYLINASGCKIPEMKLYSESAMKFSKPPIELSCNKRIKKYRVNRSANDDDDIDEFIKPPNGLKCCYQHIHRHPKNDHQYKLSKDCYPIENLLAPTSYAGEDSIIPEFVYITCNKPHQDIIEFEDIYAFVPSKHDVEERCKNAPKEDDQLSVVMLGVDSLSRLNMMRQLPKTYDILTKELNAEVLLGYNKVADNTFPNLMPMLMGHNIDELTEACEWPYNHEWDYKFDSCPLIWQNYADNGYVTMYAEECPNLSTFNFQKAGFEFEPTDYYLRPLLLAGDHLIGHTRSDNCIMCMGRKTGVDVLVDYTKQYVRKFAKRKHFAFTWSTSLTHDGFNMAGLADIPFSNALNSFIKNNDLDRTALIFFSDHGIRTSDFRLTPQGRMEERLPFFSISLPKWFKEKYSLAIKNLKINARSRLTTPFDVHETLRDLLSPSKFMQHHIIKERMHQIKINSIKPRGISLFLEIPEERTCDSAEIPRHWCTCLNYKIISSNDSNVIIAAKALVSHINDKYISEYRLNCHQLQLFKIMDARIGIPNNNMNTTGIKDYALTIQTTPGGGIFEGAVRTYQRRGKKIKHHMRFEVADTISRLNRYGEQSACIKDWIVKLYCFCKD